MYVLTTHRGETADYNAPNIGLDSHARVKDETRQIQSKEDSNGEQARYRRGAGHLRGWDGA